MDEYGVSRLLELHLNEAKGLFTVDSVVTHQRIIISQHRALRSTWKWDSKGSITGYIAVVISISGTITLTESRRQNSERSPIGNGKRRLGDSTAVVLSGTHQATLWFGGKDPRCAITWIPEQLFYDAGLNLSRPLVFSSNTLVTLLKLMMSVSLRLLRTASVSPHENQIIERVLITLAMGALISEAPEKSPVSVVSHLENAHTIMLANLTDPDFDVAVLADTLRLSRRQVQRLFNQYGTTPGEALKRMRLEVANKLAQDDSRRYSKHQIAAQSGFKSAAALRRAMESE